MKWAGKNGSVKKCPNFEVVFILLPSPFLISIVIVSSPTFTARNCSTTFDVQKIIVKNWVKKGTYNEVQIMLVIEEIYEISLVGCEMG